MKSQVIKEIPTEKVIVASKAANEFSVNEKIVAYRTPSRIAVLCKLSEKQFGFVVIGSKDTPTFVSYSPSSAIEMACSSNISGRMVYMLDTIKELTEL